MGLDPDRGLPGNMPSDIYDLCATLYGIIGLVIIQICISWERKLTYAQVET